MYRLMGWIDANARALARDERGQGTVEYVAVCVLVAVILVGVIALAKEGEGGIPQQVVSGINKALKDVAGQIR